VEILLLNDFIQQQQPALECFYRVAKPKPINQFSLCENTSSPLFTLNSSLFFIITYP